MVRDQRFPKPPIWLLVDGNNAVVTDAHGAGVMNAAAVFVRRLKDMIDHWKPVAVVTCWDSGRSFRHDLLPTYKTSRVKLPGIENALQAARDSTMQMGIATMAIDGFEADDIIATLAEQAKEHEANAVIYSSDKDLHQCICEGHTNQLIKFRRVRSSKHTSHFEPTWRWAKCIETQFSIRPDQWVDYQMLVGQPSDAIPGVPRIGDKTARELLKACGSIEGFFADQWKAPLSPAQKASLINSRPQLPLLRELCTLRRNVPLPELWLEGV
jgi:5'-3' exonuclease